jgi:beta-galactosidase/beta-glucuronidase
MIESLTIDFPRVTPLEAEVRVTVRVADAAGAELRGLVRGPLCAGRETIQTAYPLRTQSSGENTLTAGVAIPEPNLWTAEAPFTYEAAVEVWRDGQRVARATESFRLRTS